MNLLAFDLERLISGPSTGGPFMEIFDLWPTAVIISEGVVKLKGWLKRKVDKLQL